MTAPVELREATPADLAVIMRHRRRMFEDMGHRDPTALDAMERVSEPVIRRGLETGLYRGWLARAPGREVVAGGGVLLVEFPCQPGDPSPRRAWILNVYTEPPYRRRGLARRLMEVAIAWCREQGLGSVYLHASEEGRPLYEALDFAPTNEMRLDLRGAAKAEATRAGEAGRREGRAAIEEIVNRETRAWDTQDVDLLLSVFHPDMVWPWPPHARAHDPMEWVLVQGRFHRERWRRGWQALFDTHRLVHNQRLIRRIEVSNEGDGGFAVVDIDTLWRDASGAPSHWKGRVCKVYSKVGREWKMTMHTGVLEYAEAQDE